MYYAAHSPASQSASALLIDRFRDRDSSELSQDPHVLDDFRFLDLLDVLQPHGGIARAADVATELIFSSAVQLGVLAYWVQQQHVLSVVWKDVRWLPLFQFGGGGPVPCPGLQAIIKELSVRHDQWGVVNWFCKANVELGNRVPAVVLNYEIGAVVEAARAGRHWARA